MSTPDNIADMDVNSLLALETTPAQSQQSTVGDVQSAESEPMKDADIEQYMAHFDTVDKAIGSFRHEVEQFAVARHSDDRIATLVACQKKQLVIMQKVFDLLVEMNNVFSH